MIEKKLQRVLIMAGGTGGHVFPGLALADYLRQKAVDVHWLGTRSGLEAKIVPDAKIPLHFVTIQGVRGKGWRTFLFAPIQIIKAMLESRRIMKAVQPDVVIGMGGFVSGPGGLAAWLSNYPLVIHEQNAKAGMTNKWLALLAKQVLQAFPNTFTQKNVVHIGNPVRATIENLPKPSVRLKPLHQPFRLLILGGSLGAQALNELAPKALALLAENERPEIWHQTGTKHIVSTKNFYKSSRLDANVVEFITDMDKAYAWADLVLCRAGALTVSELCAAGLGAIFVPFPHAVDDHQTANAAFMVAEGAAICEQQRGLTETRLAAIVREFAHSPEKRLSMAEAAYRLRQTQVTEKIFKICQEVCR